MDFELSFIATKKLSVSPTESGRMVPPKFKVRIRLRILKGYLFIVLNCEKCPYYVEVASIDITKFLSSTQFFLLSSEYVLLLNRTTTFSLGEFRV